MAKFVPLRDCASYPSLGFCRALWTMLTVSLKDSSCPVEFIISMLGLALALLLTPQVSLAVDEHISQAIEYTMLAIDDGKYGRAEGLATHAEAALAHAEASERVNANPHTANAINQLKEAIDEGKQGHVDVATTHAEAALNNLQQVM